MGVSPCSMCGCRYRGAASHVYFQYAFVSTVLKRSHRLCPECVGQCQAWIGAVLKPADELFAAQQNPEMCGVCGEPAEKSRHLLFAYLYVDGERTDYAAVLHQQCAEAIRTDPLGSALVPLGDSPAPVD